MVGHQSTPRMQLGVAMQLKSSQKDIQGPLLESPGT